MVLPPIRQRHFEGFQAGAKTMFDAKLHRLRPLIVRHVPLQAGVQVPLHHGNRMVACDRNNCIHRQFVKKYDCRNTPNAEIIKCQLYTTRSWMYQNEV